MDEIKPALNASPATTSDLGKPATTLPLESSGPAESPRINGGRFSDDLNSVLKHADGKALNFGQLLSHFQERGHAMLLMLVCFPFILPVPTMGLSAPAGAIGCVLGLCIALNLRPWLPSRLMAREIQYNTLSSIVGHAQSLTRRTENLIRPRFGFMLWPGMRSLIGLSLISASFILALPIPLPLANSIPAVAVLLLAVGYLERDGLTVFAGHCANLGAIAFLYGSWEVVRATISKILTFL